MALFERLFGRAGAGAPASSTKPASSQAPIPVPYLDARSALGMSAVWRCVTLIADAIADMPWTEWDGDGPNARQITPPSRLVRRPMATRTRRWWTWRVVATEALFNTVHLLHIGGTDSAGRPWSLLPIPPAAILPTRVVDPYGMFPPTNYAIAGIGDVTDAQLSIVHRAPVPNVPEYLAGILDLARREFTAYLAADVHMTRYWVHGGPTTTVITSDQELDNDDAAAMAQRWVDRRTMGSDYPAVFGKGADAKPWGADPTSESAVEARREINADVGRYFGVPTRILNAPAGDSETYSNVEHDAIDLYRYTLRGYAGPVEDTISELLPGDYITGRRMRVDPSRFVEGSLTDRAAAWSAIVGAQIATADEARPSFGLPPRGYSSSPAPPADVPVEPASAGIEA
jgi:phage portal protein BeeE